MASDRNTADAGGFGERPGFGRQADRGWRDDDDGASYADQDRWRPSAEPALPPVQAQDDYADRRFGSPGAVQPDNSEDAAAKAAERARQAARDVRAAEGVQ